MFYAHYSEETGEIKGLYSTDAHPVEKLPVPRLLISWEERDRIVRTPSNASVIASKLVFKSSSTESETPIIRSIPTNEREYKKLIAAGLLFNGTVYLITDEASQHATQTLVLKQIDPTYRARLFTVDDDMPELEMNTLIFIVRSINELRYKAMQIKRGHNV